MEIIGPSGKIGHVEGHVELKSENKSRKDEMRQNNQNCIVLGLSLMEEKREWGNLRSQ